MTGYRECGIDSTARAAAASGMAASRNSTSVRGTITPASWRSAAPNTSVSTRRSSTSRSRWLLTRSRSSSSVTSSAPWCGLNPSSRTMQVRRARQQPHHGTADPRHDLEHRRHRERDALRALQGDALGHELAQHERQVRHERRDRDERHRARDARGQPPRLRASSPQGSDSVAPPYAEAKNPANVTPTCTEARNRLGSSRNRRTRSPPRPGSRSTWLSRSVSTASSEPEKNPPIVTNTTMRARLVRAPVTPVSILRSGATPPTDLTGTGGRSL